uniref:Uncharacterized protein n=1 Tax=Syphacia muris TaxID=451379 RepID=A0A0N5AYP6_9BILA
MECAASCSNESSDVRDIAVKRKRKALEAAISSCSKTRITAADCKELIKIEKQKQEPVSLEIPTDVRQTARLSILEETRRAAARAEQIGPQGWKKPPCLRTNKEFLARALRSTLPRRGRSPTATSSTKV